MTQTYTMGLLSEEDPFCVWPHYSSWYMFYWWETAVIRPWKRVNKVITTNEIPLDRADMVLGGMGENTQGYERPRAPAVFFYVDVPLANSSRED